MTDMAIYKDIAERTGGDIYIGVVGPVRTGKSTLIKRFISAMALPNIRNEYMRERAKDEMPQSAGGKTVMTTEPKFIPEEAFKVSLDANTSFNLKMIDCVGYIVPDAIGHIEDGRERMVMTPWSESPLPFEEAAEIGTKKVISEHSTIGIVVTTDGSIGEIPRSGYAEAEERIIADMKKAGKPFITVLNSAHPESEETISLANRLSESYNVSVLPINCLDMDDADILNILKTILYEFPVKEISVKLPEWFAYEESENKYSSVLNEALYSLASKIKKTGDILKEIPEFSTEDGNITLSTENISFGDGSTILKAVIPQELFYEILSEKTNIKIENEKQLFSILSDYGKSKKEYDKVADALKSVRETGYGIVSPSFDELTLEEPVIVKQSGGYGVRLKASAPSIHLIKADVETEVSPIVGTERQSEDLVKYMLKEFEEDPKKIWESDMFGKSLQMLVSEGLNTKLLGLPQDARDKMAQTLKKIINEGGGGLICILL